MTDAKLKEFSKKLDTLAKKYGITAAAFTGVEDDHYIGLFVGKMTLIKANETTLNVGRLWQHMRTTMRDNLAKFEK